MPVKLSRTALLAFVFQLFVSFGAVNCAQMQPTPVQLWRVGDDALTLKLADAIEEKLKKSHAFVLLDAAETPDTLILTITKNVDWKDIGKRTRVHYSVSFSAGKARDLGTVAGACWADEIDTCANHVVKKANRAARRLGNHVTRSVR